MMHSFRRWCWARWTCFRLRRTEWRSEWLSMVARRFSIKSKVIGEEHSIDHLYPARAHVRPGKGWRFRTYLTDIGNRHEPMFESNDAVQAVLQDYANNKRIYIRLKQVPNEFDRQAHALVGRPVPPLKMHTFLQLRIFDNNTPNRGEPVMFYEIDWDELFTNENGVQTAFFQAIASKLV